MTRALAAAALLAVLAGPAAADRVRLGNLKFAHYGAVSYMKEHCGKFGLDVQEIVFPKGIDIFPAIVKGEVDLAASAADAAIANRSGGGRIFVVAGFARGGARLVAVAGSPVQNPGPAAYPAPGSGYAGPGRQRFPSERSAVRPTPGTRRRRDP